MADAGAVVGAVVVAAVAAVEGAAGAGVTTRAGTGTTVRVPRTANRRAKSANVRSSPTAGRMWACAGRACLRFRARRKKRRRRAARRRSGLLGLGDGDWTQMQIEFRAVVVVSR